MSPKRWLQITAGFFMVFLGLIFGLTYTVDPFERRSEHSLEFDRQSVNEKQNVALWTVLDIGKHGNEKLSQANLLILGDSRAELLTSELDNPRVTEFEGHQIVNLAIGGASVSESVEILDRIEEYVDGFPELKAVVIAVPFLRFCEQERESRVEENVRMLAQPWRYYFNDLVLRRSLVSLAKLKKVQAKKGKLEISRNAILNEWLRSYQSYSKELVATRIKLIQDLRKKLAQRGVELLLYSPPGGGSRFDVIQKAGLADQRSQFVREMESIAIYRDLSNATKISGEELLYPTDPVHHDRGHLILHFLLREGLIKKP
ncbi:hypothetical protein OAF33_00715 [bacterium]|nr:hypothetical protein [bacterium]MDB4754135.1 hypothetical protein [Akkermansiaceae bacterium]